MTKPYNLQISDFAIATLCSALEQNGALKSLSVENNRISPDTLADLFESCASPNNGLIEVFSGEFGDFFVGLSDAPKYDFILTENDYRASTITGHTAYFSKRTGHLKMHFLQFFLHLECSFVCSLCSETGKN